MAFSRSLPSGERRIRRFHTRSLTTTFRVKEGGGEKSGILRIVFHWKYCETRSRRNDSAPILTHFIPLSQTSVIPPQPFFKKSPVIHLFLWLYASPSLPFLLTASPISNSKHKPKSPRNPEFVTNPFSFIMQTPTENESVPLLDANHDSMQINEDPSLSSLSNPTPGMATA